MVWVLARQWGPFPFLFFYLKTKQNPPSASLAEEGLLESLMCLGPLEPHVRLKGYSEDISILLQSS